MFALENEIVLYGEKFAAAVKAFAIIGSVDKALSKINSNAHSLEQQNQQDLEEIDKKIKKFEITINDGIAKATKDYALSLEEEFSKILPMNCISIVIMLK